ncbi:MAG: class I SAM-dependent methyltransferase [Alphaproteobacteria bacterium]|nr:class I SAM-dependent methyltransferase [Alphaproteobacteria bacterium]
MTIDRTGAVAANRIAWNESAPHHRKTQSYADLLAGFRTPGYSCLDALLTDRLRALGVQGRSVAQLCCNNGRELLSVRNLGAERCVGFDQSDAFLAQARELAASGALDCRFVETDVYAIPDAYDGQFDIVLITIGVFGWMPDLPAFMDRATRLLRPGGALLVYEQHPVMNMFDPWAEPDPTRLRESYFRAEPFEEHGPILYEDDAQLSDEGPVNYWFVHTLADVMTACLRAGLTIEAFSEHPHNISSEAYEIYNDQPAQAPQSYLLTARKA